MLACGDPGLDLLAVTTVAGNVSLQKTTHNALRMLSLAGCTDVPVGAGASEPLERLLHMAEDIHGKSGLDGPEEIPEATFEPDERGAVTLIADTLRASPEPVTLVPVGPLTNIATFLREHPDKKERVARISLMGGSMGLGNTTPAPVPTKGSGCGPRAGWEAWWPGSWITSPQLTRASSASTPHRCTIPSPSRRYSSPTC